MKQEINIKRNISFWRQKRAGFLRLTIMMFLLLFVCNQMDAQSVFVKGCVKDSHGESVIGASIVQKGVPNNGTATDLNGEFELKISKRTTLVVSFIGYDSKEVVVVPNTTLQIVLNENEKQLGDVVVVDYGI